MPSTYIGLPALTKRARAAVVDATRDGVRDLKDEIEPLIPVGESGDLAGDVETDVKVTARGAVGKVEVGSGPGFYAGWQHERTEWEHDDGQAKFVEEPLLRFQREFQQRIARAARRWF